MKLSGIFKLLITILFLSHGSLTLASECKLISDIDLHLLFKGLDISVFGKIESGQDIIISVKGPYRSATIKENYKTNYVWLSKKYNSNFNTPVFLNIASNDTKLAALQEENFVKMLKRNNNISDLVLEILVTNFKERGFYNFDNKINISRKGEYFYNLHMPSFIMPGRYTVYEKIYENGILVNKKCKIIKVSKNKLISKIYNLSVNKPTIYSILVLLCPILIGLMVNFIFQKFSNKHNKKIEKTNKLL